MTSIAPPYNPNFWICQCPEPGNVHSCFESGCQVCRQSMFDAPMATQVQVNDHADRVAAQQQAVKAYKPELPHSRKKAPPTREEFEAAVERMKAWEKRHQEQLARTEDRWKFVIRQEYAAAKEKDPDTFLIKRYQHHHAPAVSPQTKIV